MREQQVGRLDRRVEGEPDVLGVAVSRVDGRLGDLAGEGGRQRVDDVGVGRVDDDPRALGVEADGEDVPQVLAGVVGDLRQRLLHEEVLLVVGDGDVHCRPGPLLHVLREVEREDVADVHRSGGAAAGDDRVGFAGVRGGEERVEVAPRVEDAAADQRVDGVGELCALFGCQFVRAEPVEEAVVVDLALDGVRRDGELVCRHWCGGVVVGISQRATRAEGAGSTTPAGAGEARHRPNAILSTPGGVAQRQRPGVGCMIGRSR